MDGHRQRVRPDDPRGEEALDLVGPHRRFLVAGQAGDLRVGVPAAEPGQVLRDVAAQDDPGPRQDLREPRARCHRRNRIPSPPCAAGASWPSASAATTRTSEKTALLADYLRSLTPDELPIAAVFLTGRPFPEADQRATGLGWAAMSTAIAEVAGVTREDLGAAYDRHSDLGLAVEDVLVGAGHAPPPEAQPDAPRGGRHVRGDRGRLRLRPRSRGCSATSSPASDPATAKSHRQGPRRRAPDRPPGGPRRGGHRQGLRPTARRRQVGRHADRRHRPARRRSPATTPRRRPSWPSSVRSSSCSRRPPRMPPRSSGGSARRSGSRTSTTGSAPSSTSGADVRLYSRDLHDVSGAVPRGRRGRPAARLGRGPGRRDPGLQGWPGPAVHQPPGAARAQGAVGRDPGGDPGHLRGVRCARARAPATTAGRRGDGRPAPARAAARPPRTARRARPAAADEGGRFIRSHLAVAGDDRRARGRLRRLARRGATRASWSRIPTASTRRVVAALAG